MFENVFQEIHHIGSWVVHSFELNGSHAVAGSNQFPILRTKRNRRGGGLWRGRRCGGFFRTHKLLICQADEVNSGEWCHAETNRTWECRCFISVWTIYVTQWTYGNVFSEGWRGCIVQNIVFFEVPDLTLVCWNISSYSKWPNDADYICTDSK